MIGALTSRCRQQPLPLSFSGSSEIRCSLASSWQSFRRLCLT